MSNPFRIAHCSQYPNGRICGLCFPRCRISSMLEGLAARRSSGWLSSPNQGNRALPSGSYALNSTVHLFPHASGG